MGEHPHWDSWYDLSVWRKRSRNQLREHPFCAICEAHGEISVAVVCDHIEPHRGNWTLFRLGRLQSLCALCHNSAKRFVENRGFDNRIDVTGTPTDPRHPFYVGKVL